MNGANEVDIAHLEALADSLVESHDELLRALVALRKKHNLSQTVIAERMAVSQPTVAAFERYDSNPTLSTIRRYALAVGAGIDHVVEDRCCVSGDEKFEAIVNQSWTWQPVSGATWKPWSTPASKEEEPSATV
ncbi:helix-turn-helix domain-containing protein [Arthrobacter woluwensis]|uniref:helix-turn-helix domain-containing protein n=1 Tax=Arthrobacter woluwensis TaxID=156980 RepID=UPI001AAFCDBF|nr:helix-turn-helix transcriptional regulator [Arthrobacter woluwensis]QTF71246.1 helix-turn-helix transcriptional regulator [Arthrobacter woluwensis]